jgi:mRNA interferase MazF
MKQLSGANRSAQKSGNFYRPPDQGDIVHFDFGDEPDPTFQRAGREIAFPHYAIVVSPLIFNKKTGFAYLCPITSTERKWDTEIILPSGMQIQGFVLIDQLRSVDFKTRRVAIIEKAPKDFLDEVINAINLIIRVH